MPMFRLMTVFLPTALQRSLLAAVWVMAMVPGHPSGAAAEPAAHAGVDSVRWPLDLATRYLTSNFMEYRSGRFHAGLDLKTQTVTGFPVHAVESGWIVRVRATPTAYGRAVYLRGESGRTYVYAHLDRFNDTLRARLDAQRAGTGTYRARLEFRRDEIPVRRGDVLGLSGQSGTGGPHLHFEVRDANNRPVDPQRMGFAVPDTIAPRILAVRAWPVTPESRLEGAAGEHVLAAEGGLRGELPALHIRGPVAFSARIVEVADVRGHPLAPAEIEVRLDGKTVLRCRNEGYDFTENALLRLEWADLPGAREQWLYRHPANSLPGREGGLWHLGSGGRGLAPGRHEVQVRAGDSAGNVTELSFALVVGDGPLAAAATAGPGWRADPVSPVIATPESGAVITVSPFYDTPHPAVHAGVPGLRRLRYTPDAGDPVQAPLVIYVRPSALDSLQRRAAADQGLRPLGPAQSVIAGAWPIAAALPVEMARPERKGHTESWGLYRWDGRNWNHVDVWPAATGERTIVHIDSPGLHAAFADRGPPRITADTAGVTVRPCPESTVPGVTQPRWEVLPVALHDLGSGIATETIAVRLDGRALIVEPDLPRGRLLVEFPDETAPGRHRLEIAVADEAGNQAATGLDVELVE